MSTAVTPITAKEDRKRDTTDAVNTRDLKVGDEIYTLYVDYNVCKVITRRTGVNPMLRGIIPVLDQEDGLAVALHTMITGAGPKADIPKEHRTLKLSTVNEWMEDLHFASDCMVIVGELFAGALVPKSALKDLEGLDDTQESEGEDSVPPAV
jgi:hypothetical protein